MRKVPLYEVDPRQVGSGFFTKLGTAGEALSSHTLVYLDANGQWKKCDADIAATMPIVGITLDDIASGLKGRVLLQGIIGSAS